MHTLYHHMFQFYLSSIKRRYENMVFEGIARFQFYLSSIKSVFMFDATERYEKFQFYLSSIKSSLASSLKSGFLEVSILP